MTLLLLAPEGSAQPLRVERGTGGPPGDEQVLTATAWWERAISVSWAPVRDDWMDVVRAIHELSAGYAPAGEVEFSHREFMQDGKQLLAIVSHLGRLHLSVIELHGLDQRTVLVMRGRYVPPSSVRLLPA